MNFLKRSYFNLKYKITNNLLMIFMLTAIFTFIVSGLMMYSSSNKSIQLMNKAVMNSVTLQPITVYDRSSNFTTYSYKIQQKDVLSFCNSKYVDKYNYYASAMIKFKNIDKYISTDNNHNRTTVSQNSSFNFDGTLYGLIESSYDVAFTVNGYKMIKGRPITVKDSNKKICLISEELATADHLQIGDIIEAENAQKPINYTLAIVGIFSTPKGEYLTGAGFSPAETIFTPVSTIKLFLDDSEYKDKTLTYSNVCVYLKRPYYLDPFIKEVQDKMNIQNVYDSHYGNNILQIPEKFADWTPAKLVEYYDENHWYYLQIDREWYNMIAKPIESVNHITGILVVGVISGATIILILLIIISLKGRNREFGILLSFGENKYKIFEQILVEELVLILISASIGFIAGITIGSSYMHTISNDIYNSKAEELKEENKQILNGYMQEEQNFDDYGWNHAGSLDLIMKLPSRIVIQANVDSKINFATIISYIAITFGLVFVILIIQMSFILKFKPIYLLNNKK